MTLQLEVGKAYLNRSQSVVKITQETDEGFIGDDDWEYDKQGNVMFYGSVVVSATNYHLTEEFSKDGSVE
jgi:hypothetical protein